MSRQGFKQYALGLLTTASSLGFFTGAHAADRQPIDPVCANGGAIAAQSEDPVAFAGIGQRVNADGQKENIAKFNITHNSRVLQCSVAQDDFTKMVFDPNNLPPLCTQEVIDMYRAANRAVLKTVPGHKLSTESADNAVPLECMTPGGWFVSFGKTYDTAFAQEVKKDPTLKREYRSEADLPALDQDLPSHKNARLAAIVATSAELRKGSSAIHAANEADSKVRERQIDQYMQEQARPPITREVCNELEKLDGRRPGSLNCRQYPKATQ